MNCADNLDTSKLVSATMLRTIESIVILRRADIKKQKDGSFDVAVSGPFGSGMMKRADIANRFRTMSGGDIKARNLHSGKKYFVQSPCNVPVKVLYIPKNKSVELKGKPVSGRWIVYTESGDSITLNKEVFKKCFVIDRNSYLRFKSDNVVKVDKHKNRYNPLLENRREAFRREAAIRRIEEEEASQKEEASQSLSAGIGTKSTSLADDMASRIANLMKQNIAKATSNLQLNTKEVEEVTTEIWKVTSRVVNDSDKPIGFIIDNGKEEREEGNSVVFEMCSVGKISNLSARADGEKKTFKGIGFNLSELPRVKKQ